MKLKNITLKKPGFYGLASIILCFSLTQASFAANSGKITGLWAHGNPSNHGTKLNDVVQIAIEGGFSGGTCDTTYAAIRKSDDHLVKIVLAAYLSGKTINSILLNTGDKYYGNRCIITDLGI